MQESHIPGLKLVSRGKVRDIYEAGEDQLLIVTTDRISAFDVVMGDPIPDKGRILTKLSLFWFERFGSVENHLVSTNPAAFPNACQPYAEELAGRTMLVKKAQPLPVECIVRGYVSGSAWKEYQKTGEVCGIVLPKGLKESQKLPAPIFTPSTKAEQGKHDENISMDRLDEVVGDRWAEEVRGVSEALYQTASQYALERGIIIADTKFEFGLFGDKLLLIDEVLTPDSSRFWPADGYAPGGPQPSFDKQYLRDYLESLGWEKRPPAPKLPQEVIENTRAKYLEALTRITGKGLE